MTCLRLDASVVACHSEKQGRGTELRPDGEVRECRAGAPAATAAAALEAFAATWKQRYPAIIRLWRVHWE